MKYLYSIFKNHLINYSMVVTKKRRCCPFNFLSLHINETQQKEPLFTSPCSHDTSSIDFFISSDEDSIISDEDNIDYNDFYLELCTIIGNKNYFKNGIVINNTGDDNGKNWYISSTIKFQSELDDKIVLWKHIKNNIWDEKILTVKEILQLNGE